MARICLLTGAPGTGKTTIIREAISRSNIRAGGFYTQEIRIAGKRHGFSITTLDGQSAILAYIDIPGPHRVSKYGVDIAHLNATGVAAIYQAINESDVALIVEIGEMELFSPQFRTAVMAAIESGKKVLGTIMFKPAPFADDIKGYPGVEIIVVTRENRDNVLHKVVEWLNVTDENHAQTNRCC